MIFLIYFTLCKMLLPVPENQTLKIRKANTRKRCVCGEKERTGRMRIGRTAMFISPLLKAANGCNAMFAAL